MAYKDEYSRLARILDYRFPHKFRNIGIMSAFGIFFYMIFYKIYGANDPLVKDVLRTVLLGVLLIASFSKDKIEDEYTRHIRHQSYTLSFVFTAVYAISLPLISLFMDILITKVRNEGSINFHALSAFEILFMLICFQMLFYKTLKLLSCAE